MTRLFYLLPIYTFLLLGCRHGETSQGKEFVPIPPGEEPAQPSEARLNRVADIPQTVMRAMPKFTDEEMEDEFWDPEDPLKSYYSVSFGKVSQQQFDKLQAAYYKNPKLSYDAARSYDLVDFMPPQIQALSGFRFKAEDAELDIRRQVKGQIRKHEYYGLETLSNCWNAAYEIVRGASDMTSIFYIDPKVAQTFFTDDRYSKALRTYPLDRKWKEGDKARIRNEGLQPFDVILVYGSSMGSGPILQHVAIFIDDDFYFEKTGPDSYLNYRFNTFDEIAEIYSEYRDARVEVRRFQGGTLPPARETFSYKARGIDFPEGFVSAELLQKVPDLYARVTGYLPRNWEEANYSRFFYLAEVPLDYDAKRDRYVLSKAAFQKTIKDLPLRP